MIALERHIEAEQPQRSLLMSYCSSLSFFEHSLLPRLQASGDGAVTVLVDAADYENSFSDAIEGAGVDYTLQPVSLSKRFHPKLYLFTKGDTASLFVASANLTKSGFRANAEIVDRLTVSPKASGDARALLQYADLLELLPNLYPHFSASVQNEFGRAANFIRRVTQTLEVSTGGPLFLHNATTPLLDQMVSFIPGRDISEVVLISPYFDPGCVAIRKLAAAYPNAQFRIIKADEDGTLNGAALKGLKQRLTVETFLGYGKGHRALHGKVAIFKSPATSWVVTGSANLTVAAWLRPAFAEKAGNLEAVLLREQADLAAQLVTDLRTRKVGFDTLQYSPIKTPDSSSGSELLLYDAVLQRGLLTVTGVLRRAKTGRCSVSVSVEHNGLRTNVLAKLLRNEDNLAITARVSDKPIAKSESAGLVTVQLRWPDGDSAIARHWLSRPDLLMLPASERRTRSSVRSMCQQLFADAEGQIILNAIGKFMSDIGELALEGKSTLSGSTGQQQGQGTGQSSDNSEISLDGFLTDDLEVRSFGRSHRQRAATMMEQLASALRRIIVEPTDELLDDEATDIVRSSESERAHQREEDEKKEREEASGLAKEVLSDVVRAVDTAHQAPVHSSAIPFVIKVPEAISAFGLFQLRIHSVLQQTVSKDFSYNLRRMLVAALSIDGVLCGGTFGWLVRAWCQRDTHDELVRCVLSEDYWAHVKAFAAAGVLLSDIGVASDAQMQSVMAGVSLITSVPLPRDEDAQAKVSVLLDHLASSSSGKLARKGLDAVLSPLTCQNAPALRSAPRWIYLHRLHTAATPEEAAAAASRLESLAPSLLRQYQKMRSRYSDPLAYLRGGSGQETAYCTRDNLRLDNALLNRVRAADCDFVLCPHSCRRILVPYDFTDPKTTVVLEHFFPAFSQESL
jgi:HKD family nuclease